jgi:transcriptional regulator with XRE-family HTH domain
VLRVKRHRILKEQSQQDLADATGISRSIISNIENGRVNPTPTELAALGHALNCPPDRLLDHVSADPLGPGAEFRDSQREAGRV